MRLFEASLHHRLLTGEMAAEDFRQLLRLLKYPALPELPHDLTLEALAERRRSNDPFVSNQAIPNGIHVSLGAVQLVCKTQLL